MCVGRSSGVHLHTRSCVRLGMFARRFSTRVCVMKYGLRSKFRLHDSQISPMRFGIIQSVDGIGYRRDRARVGGNRGVQSLMGQNFSRHSLEVCGLDGKVLSDGESFIMIVPRRQGRITECERFFALVLLTFRNTYRI